MDKNQRLIVLYAILALSLLVNFWIYSRYQTLYGLGVYFLIPILILSSFFGVSALFVEAKKGKLLLKRFLLSFIFLTAVMTLFLRFDKYKDATYLIIPSNYSGKIFLFQTNEETKQHIHVDADGIALINVPYTNELRIKQGWRDISYAYNKAMDYEIVLSETKTTETVVTVICFDVEVGKTYKNNFGPYYYDPCLNNEMLNTWMNSGKIDFNSLVIKERQKQID